MPVVLDNATILSHATDQTSFIATEPASIGASDYILGLFVTDDAITHTIPSGWTSITSSQSGASRGVTVSVAYKKGTTANHTWVCSSANTGFVMLVRVTGANATTFQDATVAVTDAGGFTTVSCPNITTNTDGAVVVRAFGVDDGKIATQDANYPVGHTGVFARATGTGATHCTAGFAYETVATAGAAGVADFTNVLSINGNQVKVSMAIKPAAASASPLMSWNTLGKRLIRGNTL